MHDDLGYHPKNYKLEQVDGKAEASPIMPILHDLEGIASEVYLAVKVHLMERFHWDLALSMIFGAIRRLVEIKVVLNRPPWVPDFLVLPWGYAGCQ